jgi:hypothetical protein
MVWLRSLIVSGWLCVFTAYMAEQAIGPVLLTDLNSPLSKDEPLARLNQACHFSDFFMVPGGGQQTVPAPVIREPFFKWKSFLPERLLNAFSPTPSYPAFIQDMWRCPAVAIVLFPYHEFL